METKAPTAETIASLYAPDRWDDAALDALAALYADDASFQDPLQHVRGRSAFRAMMKRLADRARELRFDVRTVEEAGDTVWMTWTCVFAPLPFGPVIVLDGASRIVRRDGLIADQQDWWDALTPLVRSIPGAKTIRAALVKAFTFA